MSVTEVSEESWFSRIGGAFKGILIGIILFLLAFPLLFWNEGRAVKRAKALEKGEASVISATAEKIQPENEGKLVHVTGMLKTDDTLSDGTFGIAIKGIRLERKVEMYQWKEKSSTRSEKQLGGSVKKTTVYTYEKDWSDVLVDSSEFKEAGHSNPSVFPFENKKWYASDVKVGEFSLQQDLIRRIGAEQPFAFPEGFELPANLKGYVSGSRIMIPAATAPGAAPAVPPADGTPRIGDVRITFTQILPHNVSIVAQQVKDSFCPYPVDDDTICLLSDSIQSAELMFSKAQSSNAALTWILRIAGLLMMLIGLSMVLSPLSVLADVVPFIGDIVGIGTGIVAFLIALPCWLIVIAVAWFFYRPLLGIVLLAVAGASVFCLLKKRKKAGKAVSA